MSYATDQTPEVDAPMSRDWHWHPNLPIQNSGLFDWPPNPARIAHWFAKSWLSLCGNTLWFALAFAVWFWVSPSLETTQTLAWDWVAFLWVRNALILTFVAGGLHLYFYGLKSQKDRRRFDGRGFKENDPTFLFSSQVKDNIFWSVIGGVSFWTAFEVAYLWLFANGFLWGLTWAENPVWFAALFVIIPVWSSMNFYWVHRFLHWKPVYRRVHALHHKNITVGPWSGIAMHPVEHVLYFSSVALHFVVASHPVHMIYHLFVQALHPPLSHSGYESLEMKGGARFTTGDFFHQLHHRYFECNYGTSEMPWDKWFGSFHDGTPEATKRMRDQEKARRKSQRAADKAAAAKAQNA